MEKRGNGKENLKSEKKNGNKKVHERRCNWVNTRGKFIMAMGELLLHWFIVREEPGEYLYVCTSHVGNAKLDNRANAWPTNGLPSVVCQTWPILGRSLGAVNKNRIFLPISNRLLAHEW